MLPNPHSPPQNRPPDDRQAELASPPGPAAWPRDPTRFVLMHTSHPGNVGAVARAMKVMGFSDLVLVAPRFDDVLSREETVAMASGAADILVRARIVPTLVEALDGITCACATAMTPRDFGPPTFAPRERFASLADEGQRVAFVFGGERFGMANEDVYRCHACLSIPTDPGYGSLNLAQAVQVLAYEWRQALGGFGVAPRTVDVSRADVPAVQGLVAHWAEMLSQIEFFDPAAPRKLLPRLNRLANRAAFTVEEVHILRGIARKVQRLAASRVRPAVSEPRPAPPGDGMAPATPAANGAERGRPEQR